MTVKHQLEYPVATFSTRIVVYIILIRCAGTAK